MMKDRREFLISLVRGGGAAAVGGLVWSGLLTGRGPAL